MQGSLFEPVRKALEEAFGGLEGAPPEEPVVQKDRGLEEKTKARAAQFLSRPAQSRIQAEVAASHESDESRMPVKPLPMSEPVQGRVSTGGVRPRTTKRPDLAQAVVWSEILGAPVALRE